MLLLITFVKPQALEVGFLIDGSYSFLSSCPLVFIITNKLHCTDFELGVRSMHDVTVTSTGEISNGPV